jgi:hypothetical protein
MPRAILGAVPTHPVLDPFQRLVSAFEAALMSRTPCFLTACAHARSVAAFAQVATFMPRTGVDALLSEHDALARACILRDGMRARHAGSRLACLAAELAMLNVSPLPPLEWHVFQSERFNSLRAHLGAVTKRTRLWDAAPFAVWAMMEDLAYRTSAAKRVVTARGAGMGVGVGAHSGKGANVATTVQAKFAVGALPVGNGKASPIYVCYTRPAHGACVHISVHGMTKRVSADEAAPYIHVGTIVVQPHAVTERVHFMAVLGDTLGATRGSLSASGAAGTPRASVASGAAGTPRASVASGVIPDLVAADMGVTVRWREKPMLCSSLKGECRRATFKNMEEVFEEARAIAQVEVLRMQIKCSCPAGNLNIVKWVESDMILCACAGGLAAAATRHDRTLRLANVPPFCPLTGLGGRLDAAWWAWNHATTVSHLPRASVHSLMMRAASDFWVATKSVRWNPSECRARLADAQPWTAMQQAVAAAVCSPLPHIPARIPSSRTHARCTEWVLHYGAATEPGIVQSPKYWECVFCAQRFDATSKPASTEALWQAFLKFVRDKPRAAIQDDTANDGAASNDGAPNDAVDDTANDGAASNDGAAPNDAVDDTANDGTASNDGAADDADMALATFEEVAANVVTPST